MFLMIQIVILGTYSLIVGGDPFQLVFQTQAPGTISGSGSGSGTGNDDLTVA